MEMDLQLSLIAIGVACATAVAVYFVSVIGIREKSFEEAIAEQKKRSDDLLGHTHHKKDKKKVGGKDKSASKKLKKREKQNNNVGVSDLSDGGEVQGDGEKVAEVVEEKVGKKSHVEIVDEPEILEDEEGDDGDDGQEVKPRASSRRSSVSTGPGPRRESIIKPILLNKDESPCVSTRQEAEPANHFEQIHPKDDCELKKERSTENMLENVSTPPSPRVGSKSSGSNTPVEEPTDSPNVSKRSRGGKKLNRVEDTDITAPKIEKIIDRLALTSSEIQSLIDVLLNKQHAGDNEWVNKTKGSNTVGELKKQVEMKDKIIEEEKASVKALQDKLKELRNEFSGEKQKFAGVRRQLEEQVQRGSVEVQNLQIRLRQVGEIGLGEKQELQKQLQRMQVKFKDVQDEYEAIKIDYRNYRDAEQTIRSKADTLERESGALKTQCGHLENQLKNAFATNQDMTNQIRSLQDHIRGSEERNKEKELVMNNEYRKLQERETVLLNELAGLKSNLSALEAENGQLRGQVSKLEGSLKSLEEVNGKYEEARNSEVGLKNVVNELKSNVSKLNEVVGEKEKRVSELESVVEGLRGEVRELESGKGDERKSEVEGLEKQVGGLEREVERLRGEVDGVKGKNDELRHKNQKLVESLDVTEKTLQAKIEGYEKLVKVEDERKKKIGRVLEGILGGGVDLSSEDWVLNVLTRVQAKITELQNAVPEPVVVEQDNSAVEELKAKSKELEDEVTHYQGMLKETETLLSNLQASINEEEAKWVVQSSEKDREIERLKNLSVTVEELQRRCKELEEAGNGGSSSDELEQLRDANTSLRTSLAESKSRIQELESKLSGLESSIPAPAPQATNGSVTSNGSSEETLNPVSSNNNNKGLSSPPPSPQAAPAPPSPSAISTASSSPPVSKEKKKKKFLSRLLN